MAELKRNFRMGKMNKDLDERLIPNGEYRDALNIQVAGSEGSDVGTAQNILGNELAYSSAINVAGAKCIGSVRDTANDKIYWFISGTSRDVIAEYDQYTKEVSPVVVDANNILNFSTENKYKIIGVNIIEGFIYWTDNNSEPKKIDIKRFKAGSSNYSTHTTLIDESDGTTSYNFTIDDITVIKKAPIEAPTLTMAASRTSGIVETSLLQVSFTDSNSEPYESGLVYPLNNGFVDFTSDINLSVGDRVKLTLLDESENEEVILSVLATSPTNASSFKVNMDAVPEDVPSGNKDWKVVLMEKKALFEFKFPRFAYRYKYSDGQYSAMGPFSQVAFLPQEFDYEPRKGYNKGMVNKLRKLTISNFKTTQKPKDVVEVDILYKEDSNTNVYTVKSIKPSDDEWASNSIEIKSEVIYKVLPSMELLRPWDNVPKKAQSQELVANRIVYGNYLQQYDLKDIDNSEITPKFNVSIVQANNSDYEAGYPGKSLKSMRTYQIGIVYKDEFGRETPVLTDPSGSIILDKDQANQYNVLQISMDSNPPSWATHYKYFVKETSAEYYNLSMDRHYPAEDGNVWLAFPSSERNKVSEETFIVLKKRHDSDTFVQEEARYKILAIENNAPEFLTIEKVSKGHAVANSDGNLFVSGGYPEKQTSFIRIPHELWKVNFGGTTGSADEVNLSATAIHSQSDLVVRIKKGANITKYYDVALISYEPTVADLDYAGTTDDLPVDDGKTKYWQITIDGTFDESDVEWLGTVGGGTNVQSPQMKIEIAQKVKKLNPEFQGRFFAKIFRDTTLEQNILRFNNLDELRILAQQNYWQVGGGANGSTSTTSLGYDTGGSQSSRYNFWREKNKGNGSHPAGWHICRWGRMDFFKQLNISGDIQNNRNQGDDVDTGSNAFNDIQGFGIRQGEDVIEIGFHNFGDKFKNSKNGQDDAWGEWVKFGNTVEPQYKDMVNGIESVGNYIKFSGDPNDTVYEIKGWARNRGVGYKGRKSNGGGRSGTFASSRIIYWTIKLDKPVEWAPEDNISGITTDIDNNLPIQIGTLYVDDNDLEGFSSSNPAIWETEPKEVAELDIYYEASNAFAINTHATTQSLDYHNCYSFANGVESNRIRDDYNASQISKGVKASSVLAEQYKEEHKKTGLIYSGIFNSTSGINYLNQFVMADKVTKDLNPEYGSIQLLHTRETDLLAFCEDKVVKILANKDALYNADGNANLTASNAVLGQAIIPPTFGEFGIGVNPESFANYAYRCYFADKPRGKMLRLSMDGVTEISNYGMDDYFKDKLASSDTILGYYDDSKDLYNVTLQSNAIRNFDDTVSFMETVQGWPSRKSFIPENGLSLNNIFYTFKNGELWSHTNTKRNRFYDTSAGENDATKFYESSVNIIFNDGPDTVKGFNTLNYEGTQSKVIQNLTDNEYFNNVAKNGWYTNFITTDLQDGTVHQFKGKENKWFGYIQGTETTWNNSNQSGNLDTKEFSVQGIGKLSANPTGDTTPSKITITIVENND